MIEPDDSLVTWNDKITDPDNAGQIRQIDITIKTGIKITHVECRVHQKRQDVKWIEELYGRKVSLKADSLIAVSSSGFTRGALLKARAMNIETRTLSNIKQEDINAWKGGGIVVRHVFYHFLQLDIVFIFDVYYRHIVLGKDILHEAEKKKAINHTLDIINERLDEAGFNNVLFPFDFFIIPDKLTLFMCPVSRILVRSVVSADGKEFTVPTLEKYTALTDSASNEHAIIESSHGFEVIKSVDNVSIKFNASEVPLPENCLLSGRPLVGLGDLYNVKFLGEMDASPKISLPVLKCFVNYTSEVPRYFRYSPPFLKI
jgi:hypothetical protein